MRKALPLLCALFLLFALAPATNSLGWRTQWGLAGSKYFEGAGVYWALVRHPEFGAGLEENLDIDLIAAGAVAPDKWAGYPYFVDRRHVMTYVRDQGRYWLLRAENARIAGAWDNVSYFLGIASHYWGDAITMSQHDNARSHYIDRYGEGIGYRIWTDLHHHLREQARFHQVRYGVKGLHYFTYENSAQVTLSAYLTNVAIPKLTEFINKTIEPGTTNGMWFEWVDGSSATRNTVSYGRVTIEVRFPRDCETTKSSVNLAAVLLYNAWIRVLGLQGYF